MGRKVSFKEIITNKLTGKWCEGLALIEAYEGAFSIQNIYHVNGEQNMINKYLINTEEAIFSEVYEMTYEEALNELNVNKMTIISPKATNEVVTFEGIKRLDYGCNVFCFDKNGKILVNDRYRFEDFEEILEIGFISESELKGKWLVF